MDRARRRTEGKKSTLHTVANVLGIVLCVVFIPIIILNTVLIVKSYTNPKKLPTVFGIAPVIVMSGSMNPVFYTGDMIFLQEVDPDTLQVGDIICYFPEGPENAVTHAIVEIQEQDGQKIFITKGTANNTEDRIAVTPGMVQGKYTGHCIQGLGWVAEYLRSPGGMIVCIVLPLGLFFLWDALTRVISSKKAKGEQEKEEERSKALEEELQRLRAQLAEQEAPPENGPTPFGEERAPVPPEEGPAE